MNKFQKWIEKNRDIAIIGGVILAALILGGIVSLATNESSAEDTPEAPVAYSTPTPELSERESLRVAWSKEP